MAKNCHWQEMWISVAFWDLTVNIDIALSRFSTLHGYFTHIYIVWYNIIISSYDPRTFFSLFAGMIYAMRHVFKFKVENPCYTLKTYHHHCTTVHRNATSIKGLGLGWTSQMTSGGGLAWPKTL